MDVLRTGCSALGSVLPEATTTSSPSARDIADRLMASFGLDCSLLVPLLRIPAAASTVETDDDSIGGTFLHLLHGSEAPGAVGARDAHLAQTSTPSTSSTRPPSPAASSPATGSDMYSAITAASAR
jgi:2-methylcitrate synthase